MIQISPADLVDNAEKKLDEADQTTEATKKRLSHDEVLHNVRSAIHESGRERFLPLPD